MLFTFMVLIVTAYLFRMISIFYHAFLGYQTNVYRLNLSYCCIPCILEVLEIGILNECVAMQEKIGHKMIVYEKILV